MEITFHSVEVPGPEHEADRVEIIPSTWQAQAGRPREFIPKDSWHAKPDGRHRDPDFGPFFPVFALDADPVHPLRATTLIERGEARIAQPERAYAAVQKLIRDAHLTDQEMYYGPVHAEYALRRHERHEAILKRLGVIPGEDMDPRANVLLLDAKEVAAILRVSEDHVHRRSGIEIPAPLKIGGRKLWKADALLNYIARAV